MTSYSNFTIMCSFIIKVILEGQHYYKWKGLTFSLIIRLSLTSSCNLEQPAVKKIIIITDPKQRYLHNYFSPKLYFIVLTNRTLISRSIAGVSFEHNDLVQYLVKEIMKINCLLLIKQCCKESIFFRRVYSFFCLVMCSA